MEPATPDARAVVAELQRRAAARRPRWQPRPLPSPPVRTPMTVDESLEYLHTHWVLPERFTDVPAGPRWKQLVWRAAGRLTFGVLSRYLSEERELLSRAVQVCDTLARRVDTLEAELDTLAQAASGQLSELVPYLESAAGDEPAGAGAPATGPSGAGPAGDGDPGR